MFKKIVLFSLVFFVAIFLIWLYYPVQKPLPALPEKIIFSHRGLTTAAPENTLKAIQAAKEAGFKAVEIDVQKSADDVFFLFHDEKGKMAGTPEVISQLYMQQVRRLSIPVDGINYEIPALEEALLLHQNELIFYLDLKIPQDNPFKNLSFAARLYQFLKKHNFPENILVADGSPFIIFYLELRNSEINTVLEGFNAGKEWVHFIIPPRLRPDLYAGSVRKSSARHLQWLKKHRLIDKKISYTYNRSNYKEALEEGFKKIIMDEQPEP